MLYKFFFFNLQFFNNSGPGKIVSMDADSTVAGEVKLFIIKHEDDGTGRVITSHTLTLNENTNDKTDGNSKTKRDVRDTTATEKDNNILSKVSI